MRFRILLALSALAPTLAPTLAPAQDAPHVAPAGWQWHMDDGPDTLLRVWDQGGVWHTNTEKAGLWWDTTWVGKGKFAVEAEFLVYPESAGSEFGLVIGGTKMTEENPTYIKFVARKDGYYNVALRDGKLFHEIAPWKHTYRVETPSGEGPARNLVRIEAQASVIVFYLNGFRIFYIDHSMVKPQGQVAIRLGGGIVADISKFKIEPLAK